jgi:iron complex outermembrane receptor protein
VHGECHHHGDLVRPEKHRGVKSRGAEINLFGKVTHDLSLNTGFIWAKATYPGAISAPTARISAAPSWPMRPNTSSRFRANMRDLGENLKGFLAADAVWKSRLRYEANTVADTTFRPHWTVGGRIGVRTADERFTMAVFARNLFNVHEPSLYQSELPLQRCGQHRCHLWAAVVPLGGPVARRQVLIRSSRLPCLA